MGGSCCALGSSTVWGPTYTDDYEASQIFSDSAFADYTAVYAMYCDGGSWTGNQASPVKVGTSTIFYRGPWKRCTPSFVNRAVGGELGFVAGGRALHSYKLNASWFTKHHVPDVSSIVILW